LADGLKRPPVPLSFDGAWQFVGAEMCGAKAILKVSRDFTSGETYSRFKSRIASVALCYWRL
jgi:hypothetical protein